MPLLLASFGMLILNWLLQRVPEIVAKILIAVGIGMTTYKGFNILLDNMKSLVMDRIGGVGGDVAGILGLLQFDVCVSIILSAWTMRITLVATNGAINKISFSNKNAT